MSKEKYKNQEIIISRWKPEGYPTSYVKGFEIPDEEAIETYANYLTQQENLKCLEAIVLERSNKGTRVHTKFGSVQIAINWTEPRKNPIDYDGYARTFWGYYGPDQIQYSRAKMLSEKIGVNLVIEDTRI